MFCFIINNIIIITIFYLMEKPNGKFNAFENYGEFFQTNTDPGTKSKKKSTQVSGQDQFSNDMCSATDIDAMLKKKFCKSQYPNDLSLVNIFCPICGKIVTQKQSSSTYSSENYNRKFLAHDSCLNQQSSRLLNDLFDHVEEMTFTNNNKNSKMKILSIGDRQFCLQMAISHPLSDFKFIKLITKGHLNGNSIRWELRQQDEPFCYQPNIICFPFIDFKITVTASQIGSHENKKIITNYLNLSRIKFSNTREITGKSQQLKLDLKIHNTTQQKQQTITAMNYKYQYPEKLNLPIIQLSALQIQIPEEQYNDQQYQNSNSTIVQLLSQKNQQSSFASSIHLYSNVPKIYPYFDSPQNNRNLSGQTMNFNTQNELKLAQKNSSAEKQKVDLQKLISTGKLSSYVRNGAQSRIFQNFLDEANNEQVQMIIRTLYEEFPDLVTDQYANYMTQKLFQVCSPAQRLLILGKLFPEMSALVRNKQGTHTIQAFIALITLNEQFTLICQSIRQQFEQLCYHSISTHFIQKIIKIFPLPLTLHFYYAANQNFLKFATDKNAMCVLKYMLRRIKQNQENPAIAQIKKHFINSITLNTDKIIQDCYGNYVVQFCYQLFGQNKSSGITEMIIQKFVQFSLQKYSSSVVSKCVNTYWTDRSYVNRLKDSLKNQGIIEMYRNREGNKILLDLMDKNQNTLLREKIYNLLANHGEPSKFYHERWGMQIGIRSGPVGIEFKSFSEADNQHRSQLSNNNNTSNKKSKKK